MIETKTLDKIRAARTEAEQKLAGLENERTSLPAEIETLKRELVTNPERDPAATLATIREKEERLRAIEILAVHAEADRLRAEIDETRYPLAGYEAELQEATVAEIAAEEARKAAEAAHEEATRRVMVLNHNIADANRKIQQLEISLSKHHQTARRALAA